MVEFADAERIVRADLAQGMEGFLSIHDENSHGFAIQAQFEREADGGLSSAAGSIAIPWSYRGVHDLPRDGDDDALDADPEREQQKARLRRIFPPHDKMGFVFTGREVEVQGVTIVHEHNGPVEVSRFVDWVGAMAQIGIGLMKRPVLDTPPEGFPLPLEE